MIKKAMKKNKQITKSDSFVPVHKKHLSPFLHNTSSNFVFILRLLSGSARPSRRESQGTVKTTVELTKRVLIGTTTLGCKHLG